MTDRQLAYITSLVGQRVLPATHADGEQIQGIEEQRARYAIRLVADAAPRPSTQATSRMIDWLLSLPVRQTTATTPAAATEVAEGRYALVDDDGTTKFYTVDRPADGRWAGYTFLNAMGSDTRYPIRNRETRDRILGLIAVDPQGAMLRYAMELGRCGFCGRELTDETSRAAGIGPDCAAHRGIDRTEWTVRAEQEFAKAITGRGDSDDQQAEALS